MDVTVERYMRRKIVTDSASPQFFYLRQKPGTCKTVDAVSYTHLTLPTKLEV